MTPIKIAFLWHKHQPEYKMDGEFLLPWTRLHGVKDYYDLPEILHEFPNIKQTFNIVPSLKLQIDEYISGMYEDRVQKLTKIAAYNLNENQKKEILASFFLCNYENMILPYKRYSDLYEYAKDKQNVLDNFTAQDWRDLQVWYNLTWFGPFSRKNKAIHRYFIKGRNFTEEEKYNVLDQHIEVLKKIRLQMLSLQRMDQIEISCSPMYHPILPLLCDAQSALEALPDIPSSELNFRYPEDAKQQIKDALCYTKGVFNRRPKGMWPSEGAISDEVIELMAEQEVNWIASDEDILKNTPGALKNEIDKFFPRVFATKHGDVNILFRDHFLSDRIGFVYSSWNHHDATRDFCEHIQNIRNEIIKVYGEKALENAIIPVILDGENCWEYYKGNGRPFLRSLYRQLEQNEEFETLTISEALKRTDASFLPKLNHIRAGSWINANFSIWIGHPEDRKAWKLLNSARELVEEKKDNLSTQQFEKAMQEIYVAEGSDWYWWYGPEHNAENKGEFDTLFRWHVKEVYRILDLESPEELNHPIGVIKSEEIIEPKCEITPVISGLDKDLESWSGAGIYNARTAMSAMHQIGEILDKVMFGADANFLYIRLELLKSLEDNDSIELNLNVKNTVKLNISKAGMACSIKPNTQTIAFNYACNEHIDIAISHAIIEESDNKLKMYIKSEVKGNSITYPRQGALELHF